MCSLSTSVVVAAVTARSTSLQNDSKIIKTNEKWKYLVERLPDLKTFCNFAAMKAERTILAYKNYFRDFICSLTEAEARKVFYVIDMLKTQERVNAKFVKYN